MNFTKRKFILATMALAVTTGPALAKTIRRFSSSDGLALKGYDTTAYFAHQQAHAGAERHSVNWKGVEWRFTTAHEAEQFTATPDKFAPQFGGYCTRAMAIKREVPADPKVWRIHDGKLYVFYAAKGGKLFDKNPTQMITDAQAHWDSLEKTE